MTSSPRGRALGLLLIIATAACDLFVEPEPRLDDDIVYRPKLVETDQVFNRLAMGYGHNCALTASGEAWCWGTNSDGQLGAPTVSLCSFEFPCSWTPVRSAAPRTFAQLRAGLTRTCGLDDTGAVGCWTHHGALAPQPIGQVNAEAPGLLFTHLAVGWTRRCGVTAEGALWCWGVPYQTSPPETDSDTPVEVDVGTPIRDVGLGDAHGCALDTDDRAWCWGSNWFGQVGHGSTNTDIELEPQLVAGEHAFASLAMAGQGACALTSAGEAWCWGFPTLIGDGEMMSRNAPTRVAGNHVFTSLTAGAQHACGLKADGSAWCWGEAPLVGAGTRREYRVPVEVAGDHTVTRIAAGGVATCGLTLDGDVYCWGINTYGATGQRPPR